MTIIHFSHANGFPAPCYRKLFHFLRADFRIGYLERSGHNPRFPVEDGWRALADELANAIEQRWREPVLGVGHSLGGMLTGLAAARRPELFRAVILLDAPVIGSFTGSAVRFVKKIGLIDRITPAGITKHRRREWHSQAEALAHFRRKQVFQQFDPECLEDYVRYGVVADDGVFRLRFDPAIEYQIYRTVPHDIRGALRLLKVPAGFIGGIDSSVTRSVGLRSTRRVCRVMLIPGGHHFPFQQPEAAAAAITKMARELGAL